MRRLARTLSTSLLAAVTLAQGPVLVKDLNTTSVDVGSDLYPAAADPHTARNMDRDYFVQLGGLTFFSARDELHGNELWVSDGTAAGTVLLDLVPGSASSWPQALFVFGGAVYFGADDGVHGAVLWRTDGTVAGTWVVSTAALSPTLFTPINGTQLAFRALTAPQVWGVWVTDGTAAGTVPVAGATNVDATDMAPLPGGGVVCGSFTNFRLYRISSTLAVSLLGTAAGPIDARGFQVAGPYVYFTAQNSPNTTGPELWRTDGTSAGTMLLADVLPGTLGGTDTWVAAAYGGNFYFRARTTAGGGGNIQVWRSNGTVAGTGPLTAAVLPFPYIMEPTPSGLCIGTSQELWLTDGTAAGTAPLTYTTGGTVLAMKWCSGKLWWRSRSQSYDELNFTDFTAAGTGLVLGLRATDAFAPLAGGSILLRGGDGLTGVELWRSDGTAAGTTQVRDLYGSAMSQASTPVEFCELDAGRTMFSANDGVHGYELWITDGTAAGTTLVADLAPGDQGSGPIWLERLGNRVLFVANDGTLGQELYASDGTTAGTVLVKDINSLNASSPAGLVRVRDRVYFQAMDDNFDTELWRSDGTAAGTVLVADLDVAASSNPTDLCEVGDSGNFVFAATVGGDRELWISNGTAAGTMLLKDIDPVGSSSPVWMTRCGDKVVFRADDGVHGTELWITDGTAAGTVLLLDIMPGGLSSMPRGFSAGDDGRCVFTCEDYLTAGQELWVTDGTPAGTVMVADLVPGPGSLLPSHITWSGNRNIYLQGTDATNGSELWVVNGLPATGASLVAELQPGQPSSSPSGTAHGRESFQDSFGRVFLAADDGVHGSELYVIPQGAWAKAIDRPCGTGSNLPRLRATPPVLGATCTFTNTRAVVPGWVVFGLHLGPPQPVDLGGGCRNHLFGGFIPVVGWVPTPGATWSVPIPVPLAPAMAGIQLGGQSIYTVTFTAIDGWSNGVWLQLGM